jgi:hypothetical protein
VIPCGWEPEDLADWIDATREARADQRREAERDEAGSRPPRVETPRSLDNEETFSESRSED